MVRRPIAGGWLSRKIAPGVEMPLLGLGVWEIDDGPATEDAVAWALERGYRHIDTAQAYGNEESVGRGLMVGGVRREDLFVTTKFDPSQADPVAELERSLERLGLERVDLYLVHWPEGGATASWPRMEEALDAGLTRAIGVSNFDAAELAEVCEIAEVRPAVNQIRLSPFTRRAGLLAACERLGVVPEAYSPLTRGERLDHEVIARVATAKSVTPAQAMLRWAVQRSIPVIPKSVHRERIIENARIFDFELTDSELAELDSLDESPGTEAAVENPWWTLRGRAGESVSRMLGPLRE